MSFFPKMTGPLITMENDSFDDTYEFSESAPSEGTGTVVVLVPEEVQADSDRKSEVRKIPPYAVILHDDPNNGFDFVVLSLQKVFGFSAEKAKQLTKNVDLNGKGQVWTGMKEHAEFKADQLVACGPDPVVSMKDAHPLRVTIEPIS